MNYLFGYIKINKPELKVGDYDVYRGIYCSLCKELGHSFGFFLRFSLNYDFTFLALVKMAINNESCAFKKSHCSFNPFRKCNCCEKGNDQVKFSAYVAVIMLYFKIKDNIRDNKLLKRLSMYFLLPLITVYYKKAKEKLPEIEKILSKSIEQQNSIEDEKTPNIDLAANPTSSALGDIFAYGEEDENQSRVLKHLGYCIGRYVYIMDAIDDLDEDLKNGQYNPFIISDELLKTDSTQQTKEKAIEIIDRTIFEIQNTYELLNVSRFNNIIENIIYEGLIVEKEKLISKSKVEVRG